MFVALFCTLVVVFGSAIIQASPTQPKNDYKDLTSLCWLKYAGVCVLKSDQCPFSGRSWSIHSAGICRKASRRCCIPNRKNAPIIKRRDAECGVSKFSNKFRVHNGWRAMPKEWRWQISLRKNGAHTCGGSIIDENWVLTAAHCTYFDRKFVNVSAYTVAAADLDLTYKEPYEQIVEVDEIYDHPEFHNPEMSNDITLIRLKEPLVFNDYVGPVCLPRIKEKFDNMVCSVTGYGTNENNEDSLHLMELNKPIVPIRSCQRKHCDEFNEIYAQNICAGFKEGKRDACQGDSGGPLVCQKRDSKGKKRWVQAGVVSYGSGCGLKDLPGIYTRVSDYLDWIEHIKANGNSEPLFEPHPVKNLFNSTCPQPVY